MDPMLNPGMPMNIVPPSMQAAMSQPQTPLGILNGATAPNPQGNNQMQLIQQAQRLMQGNGQVPQMQPIQMARPVGSQGIDPMKLLAAMQQNKLLNA